MEAEFFWAKQMAKKILELSLVDKKGQIFNFLAVGGAVGGGGDVPQL